MKFQTASAIFLAMTSAVDAVVFYDTSIPTPVCAKFNTFRVEGIGEFVNTDNSVPSPLTTGDMSISASFSGMTASGQYPNQIYWRNINLEMNAICVVTEDQPSDPTMGTAPTCFYEAQFGFCRPYFTFPDIKVEKEFVRRDQVVDVAPIIAEYERELAGGGRRTQQVRRAQDKAFVVEETFSKEQADDKADDETLVEAVRVTKEVYEANPKLMEMICPQLYCLIPFCFARSGGFTAHGTGNQDLKITGGTDGLFGAFGQITGTSPINFPYPQPTGLDPGDIAYDFAVDIEICY